MQMLIQDAISKSVSEFLGSVNSSLAFLTEDDMRCRLFSVLQKDVPLTINSRSVSIHSEIRWYGDCRGNRRPLKFRSDIAVIDDTTLNDDSVFFKAPSKGYGFNEYYGIIELKLRRRNGASDTKFIKSIESDVTKMQEINRLTSPIHNPLFVLVIFDKKRDIRRVPPAPNGVDLHYSFIDTTPRTMVRQLQSKKEQHGSSD